MNECEQPLNLLWLQSGGCGGCSMSLISAESPDLLRSLQSVNINLLWHPSLSEQSGSELLELIQKIVAGEIKLDILCLEGSVIQGPDGSGLFHRLSGTQSPMRDSIKELSLLSDHVLAVGSCAAFGGITAGGGNPSEACGLQYDGSQSGGLLGKDFNSKSGLPVINIAGCPTHPNWIIETLSQIAMSDMDMTGLDEFNRPRSYTDHLVHHACPRNEYYEYKASAQKASDLGCMMENMGCLGTIAQADCNTRLWNGEGSCLRGGYACINCTAPEFEEPGHRFDKTPKIAGIPIGLPTDMPKAWFVALASLSKAATPVRLRRNAVADHIVIKPLKKIKDK
ncbi:MAG: HupU protein [Gammaproteobacteria bacterium]|nr:HupU protein [Gammaproteobacteria bacterium]